MLERTAAAGRGQKTWIRRSPARSRGPPPPSPGSTRRWTITRCAPAFLYRARLDAVRRQAAVDGQAIDPWHLAAVLEGFRLRMDGALRIIDRGAILDAARHALDLHQWLVAPDFDQEGEVQQAERHLAEPRRPATPRCSPPPPACAWIDAGGTRPPIRAALIRFWTTQRLLRAPVPLTGAAALRADTPWDASAWIPAFLTALAVEAEDALDLLIDLERAWFAARAAVAGRRRNSRAAAAVDILAAAPLVSATSLAAGLGMAVKNAAGLLDDFCAAGIAVEVTHRSKRRLFGLTGLAPLREAVRPPYRPEPGRGRGRPPARGRGRRSACRAAAGGPADADRSPAVRLQRPRPLDDADGSGHPADAAHAERRRPAATQDTDVASDPVDARLATAAKR